MPSLRIWAQSRPMSLSSFFLYSISRSFCMRSFLLMKSRDSPMVLLPLSWLPPMPLSSLPEPGPPLP